MAVHVVTFTEILQAVVDTARQATGARLGYLGQPAQKPEVPFIAWVEFVNANAVGRNHSVRDEDGFKVRHGIEHVISATVTVMVGVFALGEDETTALAQAAQDLMCAFEADETLRGTRDDDLVDSCTLGAVSIVRAPWDETMTYVGVQAPVTIRKLR